MFAVSGWSVTAPLKTQLSTTANGTQHQSKKLTPQEQISARLNRDKHDEDTTETAKEQNERTKKRNLKRKRKNGKDITTVTAENVEGLYESVIEGKKPKRIRSKKKAKTAPAEDGEITGVKENETVTGSTTVDPENSASSKPKPKTKKQPIPSTTTIQEPKLTPLQASMRAKLTSARFRHLNEQLYTTSSPTALELFTSSPELFGEYHSGFRQQVQSWPSNPLDAYIIELRTRGSIKKFNANDMKPGASVWSSTPLPRTKGTCTVADIGCGDARLASVLSAGSSKLNLKILSFDLHSPSPLVTKADAANLPITDGSVDVAIFCLALMGTNWLEFIDEAWRVLRRDGELWISEIKSRFGRPATTSATGTKAAAGKQGANARPAGFTKGGIGTHRSHVPSLNLSAQDEAELHSTIDVPDATGRPAETPGEKTDISHFITALRRRGFALAGPEKENVDLRNKMFVGMRFTKAAMPVKGKNVPVDHEEIDDGRGGKRFGDRVGKKKMKYLEDVDDKVGDEDEGKILKPCVYKLR